MICPCCFQKVDKVAPLDALRALHLPRSQSMLLELFVEKYPEHLSRIKLVNTLYDGDPAGGPDSAENIVSIMITRLRKQLKAFGWTITSGHHGYALITEDVYAKYL